MIDLFWLILLAHLIADFPLQMDWIYSLKEKYSWGVLPHVGIFFFFSICFALPFINIATFWVGLLTLVISHAIIDRTKIILTRKHFKDSFLLFAIDQALHIFLIRIVTSKIMQANGIVDNFLFFNEFFLNKGLHIFLCGLIITVFGGTIILYYFKLWFVNRYTEKQFCSPVELPVFRKRIPGYIERGVSYVAFIIGGYCLMLVPAAFVPGLFFLWHTNKNRKLIISNFIISLLIIILTSLLVIFL